MDAHALLTSQGWRGKGHSLHKSSDTIGLARPLLVSQKQNNLGVGKKQHRTSDMWWMNAFDKALKGLDASEEGMVVQTVSNGALDMVAKGGGKWVGKAGLYACFVKGEGLKGSLEDGYEVEVEEKVEFDVEVVEKKEKRRRREGETKEQRRTRKLAKRAKRAAAQESDASSPSNAAEGDEPTEIEIETKEERKERRRLKKAQRQGEQEASEAQTLAENTTKKKRRKD